MNEDCTHLAPTPAFHSGENPLCRPALIRRVLPGSSLIRPFPMRVIRVQSYCMAIACNNLCRVGNAMCKAHKSAVGVPIKTAATMAPKVTILDFCEYPGCNHMCRRHWNFCRPHRGWRVTPKPLVRKQDIHTELADIATRLKLAVSNPPIIVDRRQFDDWVAASAVPPGAHATIAEVRRLVTDALINQGVPFREVGSTARGLALSGPAIDMDLMSQLPKKKQALVRAAMTSASFVHVQQFQIPNRELWVDRFKHKSFPQHPVEISYFQLAHERLAHNALVDKLLKLSTGETVRDAIVGMKRWLRTVEARLEFDTLTKHFPLRAPSVLLECLVAAARDQFSNGGVQPTAFELCLASLQDLAANGSGAGHGHVTQPMHNGTTWDVLQEAARCTLLRF
jgi:GrpB-like predicted nucleotidyltransferase (UPF0157 family)